MLQLADRMQGVSLRFLGAARTVTGSKYLLESGSSRILVDAGLFQGLKDLRLRNRDPFPVPPASLDAIVLTHAHLDHCGHLPRLVMQGFRGRVFCTAGTRKLCRIVLPDAGRIQEEDAANANRHGYSKHHPALPLYTENDAVRAVSLLQPVGYERAMPVAPGIEAHESRARRREHAGHERRLCAFCTTRFRTIASAAESRELTGTKTPAIVISSSGMATGGRVPHLTAALPDARNTVLLVGYQAEGTRGRHLLNGVESVKIHGAQVQVRARIERIESMSAHADSSEILRWLGGFDRPPAMTYLVHGEPGAMSVLAGSIEQALGWPVYVPALGETVALALEQVR